MRGKALRRRLHAPLERITPACAGKRTRSGFFHLWSRDHPRVCGEKSAAFFATLGKSGSPPRVRGKVKITAAVAKHAGITPACAGKRHGRRRNPALRRDHPRVCGEKFDVVPHHAQSIGSPPRVRGKVKRDGSDDDLCGITPACAGKSLTCPRSHLSQRDHPRVCGEKGAGQREAGAGVGSPPRVRGKV